MINKIGHIGIFVTNIESAVNRFCLVFDLPLPPINVVSERNMKVAVVQLGKVGLEFVEDFSEQGSITRMVREKGDFIHHFCLLADDIDAEINELKRKGVKMTQSSPELGLRGKRTTFVASGILSDIPIELSEP